MTLVFKASWYEHVTEQTDDDGNSILVFKYAIEDEETIVKRTPPEITVIFGPPAPEKITPDDSVSVLEAVKLHGIVRFAYVSGGEFCWEPHGIRFEYGYENYNDEPGEGFDSLEDRYPCLACANQNYFLLDRAKKNATGEPLIVLFLAMVRDYELENHDGSFDEMDIFDEKHQQKDPYCIGGFLLRVIGAYILEDALDFENCGMG
jgi:hypothetical protein